MSLLSDLLGDELYMTLKKISKPVVVYGSLIVGASLLLSFLFHSSFVCWLLNWFTGTSILFIVYIVALLVYLDRQADVELPWNYEWDSEQRIEKPIQYKRTIVLGSILMFLGIVVVIVTNIHRRQYNFECDTFYVDKSRMVYHIPNSGCPFIQPDDMELEHGYEIENDYSLCPSCKDWEDYAKDASLHDRF